MKRIIFSVMLIIGIIAAIWLLEQGKVGPSGVVEEISISNMSQEEKAQQFDSAKEITSPDGFVNTERITIGEHVGDKVVLIDFWTYSCINCQRTFPYLNDWYDKYADQGLEIIGIHTPEFDFEKKLENVKQAVEKYNITFPVVLDNDYSTWRAYKNNYWPRKYLIDIDGYIVYDHIGEGGYEETEQEIVTALNERAERLGLPRVKMEMSNISSDLISRGGQRTPEIYLGSKRLEVLASTGVCEPGDVCLFNVPETLPMHHFALDGHWSIQPEFTRLKEGQGKVLLNFTAHDVHVVAGSEEPIVGRVYLDGEPIRQHVAGRDVKNGMVTIHEEDLYNLIRLKEGGEHVLEIHFDEPGVEVFTFTFG